MQHILRCSLSRRTVFNVDSRNHHSTGILDSPRTCLHSLLSILGKGLESRLGPSCLQKTPRLAQLTYHMIYKLCANCDTWSPTLRYLRTAQDFLYRQLQHVPFQLPNSGKYLFIFHTIQNSAGSILDISKYRDTCERSISILDGIAIL